MVGDIKVGAEDIEITPEPDGEKIGLRVFVKGFNQEQSKQYSHLVYIFLDHIIGEYDMETRVGFIEIYPFEKTSSNKRFGINDFPAVFDALTEKQNYKNN